MVLVILIALWAMVLLPPYLKDRQASKRMFSSSPTLGRSASPAQRFLPLQGTNASYSTAAVAAPTGMRTAGATVARPTGVSPLAGYSNVVPFRPLGAASAPATDPYVSAFSDAAVSDEPASRRLPEASSGVGVPRSSHAARERRRQVLLSLTGLAVFTLLLALFVGGTWIAINVLIDCVMVGYVILLVRHRQMAMERLMKIEPIRPPVNEQPPSFLQVAPSYLLQSGTGN